MSNDAPSKAPNARPKRTFTVTVGLSTVISSLLVVCAGFVAMFALGVLLGRGYDPEAGIPELERMMPQPSRPSAPVVISEGDPLPAPETAPDDKNDKGILSQGDLAYPDSLRTPARSAAPRAQKPEQPAKQEQAPKPARQQQAGTPEKAQQPRPAEKPAARQRAGASASPGLAPLPMTGTAPVQTAAQGREQARDQAQGRSDAQSYHYVYQAAAYKDQESGDRFTAKLKKAGVRARTVKSTDNGTTWYRVMVDFTGKPDDTDALRAKLNSLGAGKPLMKSKVPAN